MLPWSAALAPAVTSQRSIACCLAALLANGVRVACRLPGGHAMPCLLVHIDCAGHQRAPATQPGEEEVVGFHARAAAQVLYRCWKVLA
jgi:hypothetical protein